MNITKENVDDLNVVVRITINEEDYKEQVSKALKEYGRKANIPGFRPGMVPAGLLQKKFGPAVRAEEVNKIINETLSKYIASEQLRVLGEPLPSKNRKPIDIMSESEYEFSFDLGLAPEIDLSGIGEYSLPYYKVSLDAERKAQIIENYAKNLAISTPAEVVEGGENLRGDFQELDAEGNLLENGIVSENALVALGVIKDEETLAAFAGANVNQIITLDIEKAFINESDRAAVLQTEKEALATTSGKFQFTIRSIERFENHPIDQELFDRVAGPGVISSIEELEHHIENEVAKNYQRPSDAIFMQQFRNLFFEKQQISLPSEFLKRWLKENNDSLEESVFENEFPAFEESTKWQLVREKIYRDNKLQIAREELEEEAINVVEAQFAQYGFPVGSVPRENFRTMAQDMLKKEKEAERIFENLQVTKVANWLVANTNTENKWVSEEEYSVIFDSYYGKDNQE